MRSFFSLFYKPFYSKEYYYQILTAWTGKNLVLLFLMTAVVLLPTMMKLTDDIERFVEIRATFYIDQTPKIDVKNGRLTIDKPLPYYIKGRDDRIIIAFVDTPTVTDMSAPCVVTKNKIVVRENRDFTKTYDMNQLYDFSLDRESLRDMAPYAKFMAFIIYPFAIVIFYLYHLFISLIVFAVASIFARRMQIHIGRENLYRATVVAMLPMMYCSAFLNLFGIGTAGILFPTVMISTMYVLYAIVSYKIYGQTGGQTKEISPGDG